MNIDPEQLGVSWSHSVTIRGAAIPLLPPREVQADNAGASRGWLVALALGAWKILRSAFVRRDDVAAVRAQVRTVVPPSHRDLVDRMDGGELATVYAVYMGAQSAWMMELAVASSKAAMGGSGGKGHEQGAALAAAAPAAGRERPARSAAARGIPLVGGRLPQHVLGGAAWGRAVVEDPNMEGVSKAV